MKITNINTTLTTIASENNLTLSLDTITLKRSQDFINDFPDKTIEIIDPSIKVETQPETKIQILGDIKLPPHLGVHLNKKLSNTRLTILVEKKEAIWEVIIGLEADYTLTSNPWSMRGYLEETDTFYLELDKNTVVNQSLDQLLQLGGIQDKSVFFGSFKEHLSFLQFKSFVLNIDFAKGQSYELLYQIEIDREWVIWQDKITLVKPQLELGVIVEHDQKSGISTFGHINAIVQLFSKDFLVSMALSSHKIWEFDIVALNESGLPDFREILDFVDKNGEAGRVISELGKLKIPMPVLHHLSIAFDPHTAQFHSAQMSLTLKVEDYYFNTLFYYPSILFSGSLAPNQNVSLKTLVAKYFQPLPEQFPDVAITSFDVSIEPLQFDFSFYITTRTEIKIPLGSKHAGLEQVELEISRENNRFKGSFAASFFIAELRFCVEATSPEIPDSGWTFSGGTIENRDFDLTKFVAGFARDAGIDTPVSIPELKARNLLISYNTKNAQFIFAGEIEIFIALPWNLEVLMGRVSANLVSEWNETTQKRSFSGDLKGILHYHKAQFFTTITLGDKKEIKGGIPEGQVLNITEIVDSFLPKGTELPEEFPKDLQFTELEFTVEPDKFLELKGRVKNISIPFNLGDVKFTVEEAGIYLKREQNGKKHEKGKIEFRIDFSASGQINEDFKLEKLKLGFDYADNSDIKNWNLKGEIEAVLFGKRLPQIGARYAGEGKAKELELFYNYEPSRDGEITHLIEIPNMASFDLKELKFLIKKKAENREWQIYAISDLHVYIQDGSARNTIIKIDDGTLNLYNKTTGSDKESGIEYTVGNARTGKIPLFEHEIYAEGNPRRSVQEAVQFVQVDRKTFAFDFGFAGASVKWKNDEWFFSAGADIRFYDPPKPIDIFFPKSVEGRFLVGRQQEDLSIKLQVSRLLNDLEIQFPKIPGTEISVGTCMLNLYNMGIVFSKEVALYGEIVVGIPSQLNNLFGVDEQGKPQVEIFRTYAANGTKEEKENSLTRVKLEVGSSGVGGKLINSPLKGLPVSDNRIIIDSEHIGKFEFQIPKFKLDLKTSSLKFSGGFKVDEEVGLRIPLQPLKALLKAASDVGVLAGASEASFLDKIAQEIPASVPITTFSLYDEIKNEFDYLKLEELLNIKLPEGVRGIFNVIQDRANELPDRFKHYLNFKLPTDLSFAIDVTADGGVKVNFKSESTPIKILIPQLPNLMGIELSSFSIGQAFSGMLTIINMDARIDQFDLLTLAGSLIIPKEPLEPYLPSSRHIRSTFICDELTLFVIFINGIPIPIPIFYKELGVSIMHMTGIEMQSHFHFPMPKLSVTDLGKMVMDLYNFFTKEDYFLNTKPSENNTLIFKVGPQYLGMPRFVGFKEKTISKADYRTRHYPIGFRTLDQTYTDKIIIIGETIGFTEDVIELNSLQIINVLLNALKKRSFNYLIQHIELEKYRLGDFNIDLFNFLNTQFAYAITTPREFSDKALEVVSKRFEEKYKERTGTDLIMSRDTDELLNIMPAGGSVLIEGKEEDQKSIGKEDEGLVIFTRGLLEVGGVLHFQSSFGLCMTGSTGFGLGILFYGKVADILEVKLSGLVKMMFPASNKDLDAQQVFLLEGETYFQIMNNTILEGKFKMEILNNGKFEIGAEGELNLFPKEIYGPDFPLSVYSGYRRDHPNREKNKVIKGKINNERLEFEGQMNFEMGFLNLSGRVEIKSGKFANETLNFFKAEFQILNGVAVFEMQQKGNDFHLVAKSTPLNLVNGLVRLTDANEKEGPDLDLLIVDKEFKHFKISGKAGLLGISSTIVSDVTKQRMLFLFRNEIKFPGFFGKMEFNCLSIPGKKFAANAALELRLNLGELLAHVIKNITKISFPIIDLTTGFNLSFEILAVELIDQEEEDYQRRKQEYERLEAERRRQRQVAEEAIKAAIALRVKVFNRRNELERQLAEARKAIETINSQIAGLQREILEVKEKIKNAPNEEDVEQYKERLEALTIKVKKLGDEIQEYEEFINGQKSRYEEERNKLKPEITELNRKIKESHNAREVTKLKIELKKLSRLSSQYSAKIDALIKFQEVALDPNNLRSDLLQKTNQKQVLEEEVKMAMEHKDLLNHMNTGLAKKVELLETELEFARYYAQTGEILEVREPIKRSSSLRIKLKGEFFFLGVKLRVPELNIQWDNIESKNLSSLRVLSDLSTILNKWIADHIVELTYGAFTSMNKLFLHLVRIVTNYEYRKAQLDRSATSFQNEVMKKQKEIDVSSENLPTSISSLDTPEQIGYANNITPVDVDRETELSTLFTRSDLNDTELLQRMEYQKENQKQIIDLLANNKSLEESEIKRILIESGWGASEIENFNVEG